MNVLDQQPHDYWAQGSHVLLSRRSKFITNGYSHADP